MQAFAWIFVRLASCENNRKGELSETNTVDVGVLDVVPGFCKKRKKIARTYVDERIYGWMLEIGVSG